MSRRNRIPLGILAILLALVSWHAPAIAADPPAPAAGAAPVAQIGIVGAKSLDAVVAFAKEAGIPLPPFFSAEVIEKLPFVGKDGLATDKPIGIAFFAGNNSNPEESMAFLLPVKPTAATIDSIKAGGGKPMADHPEILVVESSAFIRTADLLVFVPKAELAPAVKVEALSDALKSPATLVKVVINGDALRQTMGDQIKQAMGFLEQAAEKNGTGQMIQSYKDAIDTVKSIELTLDTPDAGVRLALTLSPLKLPDLPTAMRPGMPAGVVGRLDSTYKVPVPSAMLVKSIIDDMEKKAGKPVTDDQKTHIATFAAHIVKLVGNSVSTSIGVQIVGKDPVVYFVQQGASPMDFPLEIRKLIGEANAIDPNSTADLQSFDKDGVSVLRIVFKEKGKPVGCADVAQKDQQLFLTVSPTQYLYIHNLVAAANEGPVKSSASISINLEKIVGAMAGIPDSPLAGMPADTQKQISDLLHGQTLNFITTTDGGATTFELTASKGLLQNAPKIMQIFGAGPAPAPATEPAK